MAVAMATVRIVTTITTTSTVIEQQKIYLNKHEYIYYKMCIDRLAENWTGEDVCLCVKWPDKCGRLRMRESSWGIFANASS